MKQVKETIIPELTSQPLLRGGFRGLLRMTVMMAALYRKASDALLRCSYTKCYVTPCIQPRKESATKDRHRNEI